MNSLGANVVLVVLVVVVVVAIEQAMLTNVVVGVNSASLSMPLPQSWQVAG